MIAARRAAAIALCLLVQGLLAGCSGGREPEASVVDVVVAAPSSSAVAATTAASTVKVAADPGRSELELDNPRRVLLPPQPLATGSSLPPQTAVPLLPSGTAMLSPVFVAVATAQASGATPEGQPISGAFKQGDTLHLPVMLQPGRCLTIIAVSTGVTELDISLVAVPAPTIPPITLAMDSTTGPTAVVGGGGNCFKHPMPLAMPAVAVITAKAGAGAVLAQALSR